MTILSGQNLRAGHVLGKITKDFTATVQAVIGNSGDGTTGSVTVGAGAKPGAYRLTMIEPASNAGRFLVEDPDGVHIGSGTVGVAFSGGGLTFTVNDGSFDFSAGDQFIITVAAGSGKYKEYNPANTDGSEKAVAILLTSMDATGGDRKAVVIAFSAEVVKGTLQWFSGATSNQKEVAYKDLVAVVIIARESL